ncbi:MAG: hypothetical protein AB7F79_12055 [Steroidobacteraceae bacterium]
MPTIVIDPEDGGTQAGTQQPAPQGFKAKPIREQLDTPINPEGECCVLDGKPCILYPNWDYGEDWSGEFVREVHPFMLLSAAKVGPEEFWRLV